MSGNSTSCSNAPGAPAGAVPGPLVGRSELEALYRALNRREYVHPDPLEFLYRYEDPSDREVAGILAASLAYGRVKQILSSVSAALERLDASPAAFLATSTMESLRKAFRGFKHRFTTGEEIASLLLGVREMQARHGSLGARFVDLARDQDETVLPALGCFVGELGSASSCSTGSSVLPLPERGSACKRLHLFLRWMVRRDDVDPGGWDGVSRAKLIVPLDTHMHRIARALGLTHRAQADSKTALEVTAGFRRISPDDPVKYDFALTRLGIRTDVAAEVIPPRVLALLA